MTGVLGSSTWVGTASPIFCELCSAMVYARVPLFSNPVCGRRLLADSCCAVEHFVEVSWLLLLPSLLLLLPPLLLPPLLLLLPSLLLLLLPGAPSPAQEWREGVVKVQRPGLKDLFDIDLKNIRWGCVSCSLQLLMDPGSTTWPRTPTHLVLLHC